MNGKKAYVGMSGGVDSSVSVALLKDRGFDVTGVFIKVWQPEWFECSWKEDRLDAMRVCAHLDIPFVTLNLEKEYKKEVVDHMISEYKAGRTPNPDVMCNKHVKFGAFFDWAMANGADVVATGHYARIEERDGSFRLLSGKDAGKDQSYFLWTLTQRELSRTLFPVGEMEKTETRNLARRFKLPVAEKKDSQGLCFIGKVDIKEFLSHYLKPKRGKILDEAGKAIGEHDGAIFLTLGQKIGFEKKDKSPDEKPYYVSARDIKNNTVVVSHRSLDGSLSSEKIEYRLTSINWISDAPQSNGKYHARIRHLGELYPCEINNDKVAFEEPLLVVAGQSVVIYDGDTCIGGGIVV